jgi:hypothetical protein
LAPDGGVAQSVEQTAHIRYVGGSIPSAAISFFKAWRVSAAKEIDDTYETYIPGIQKKH